MLLRPPSSTLFPYTTLFRSDGKQVHDEPGIDTSANDARAALSAELIETFRQCRFAQGREEQFFTRGDDADADRKSTRLNSSHMSISYAVFCLKKKKNNSSIV